MADHGIIRRKIGAARAGAPPQDSGAARLWQVALARAARDETGLMLDIPPVREGRMSLAELLELMPDLGLIALLESPGGGLGLVAFSPGLAAALVEVQTVGQVTPGDPPPRRPTRTDAAMMVGVIDRALAAYATAAGAAGGAPAPGGWCYSGFLPDPRPLGLLLEDLPYQVLRATAGIGGVREGSAILALPEGGGAVPAPARDRMAGTGQDWADRLAAVVDRAEVPLTAVLCRLRLPLAQVTALVPGAVLHLGPAGPDRITVESSGGQGLAEARLGQHRGHRALRLHGAAQLAEGVLAEAAAGPAPPKPPPQASPPQPPQPVPGAAMAAEPGPLVRSA